MDSQVFFLTLTVGRLLKTPWSGRFTISFKKALLSPKFSLSFHCPYSESRKSFTFSPDLPLLLGYLKKRRFGTLYKGLVSILLGGAPSRWLLTQHWFRAWVGGPPSIESSNSLSDSFPLPISCHASFFSESVPFVNQSRFAINKGKQSINQEPNLIESFLSNLSNS